MLLFEACKSREIEIWGQQSHMDEAQDIGNLLSCSRIIQSKDPCDQHHSNCVFLHELD